MAKALLAACVLAALACAAAIPVRERMRFPSKPKCKPAADETKCRAIAGCAWIHPSIPRARGLPGCCIDGNTLRAGLESSWPYCGWSLSWTRSPEKDAAATADVVAITRSLIAIMRDSKPSNRPAQCRTFFSIVQDQNREYAKYRKMTFKPYNLPDVSVKDKADTASTVSDTVTKIFETATKTGDAVNVGAVLGGAALGAVGTAADIGQKVLMTRMELESMAGIHAPERQRWCNQEFACLKDGRTSTTLTVFQDILTEKAPSKVLPTDVQREVDQLDRDGLISGNNEYSLQCDICPLIGVQQDPAAATTNRNWFTQMAAACRDLGTATKTKDAMIKQAQLGFAPKAI